ncbi:hypothetical protein ACFFV7_41115 [Nonomuraea spiralis]|uniref:RapZ C-terminal domain-containing protein n=1 Tax=Nonomuraea spiralis TaxID=46182 RepID=A0ABV5IUH5_9ACTN
MGCAGGKHRAAGLVEILAARLREHGQAVDVDHRHAHLPRVLTQLSVRDRSYRPRAPFSHPTTCTAEIPRPP